MRLLQICKVVQIIFILVLAISSTAHSEKHLSLVPLLIDLEGWEADQADGMSMDMGNMKMTQAMRNYDKDERQVTAMVMIGSNMMTQGKMQEMNMESDNIKASVTQIDGFTVSTAYDKNEKAGQVVVFLSKSQNESAMFILTYEKIKEDEALNLSKKFNWKKMKGVVEKLLQ